MLKSKDFMELEKLADQCFMAERNAGRAQMAESGTDWQKAMTDTINLERAFWQKLYAMRGENALAACAVDPRNP